jgi:hypothetical protein
MMEGLSGFADVMFTIMACVALLAGIYVGTKWALAATKRRERELSPTDVSRFEQLQNAVDSIAIEVERIAEAQRFTAKLAAERNEKPPLLR